MIFHELRSQRLKQGLLVVVPGTFTLFATLTSDLVAMFFATLLAISISTSTLAANRTATVSPWILGELIFAVAWRAKLNVVEGLDARQGIWAFVVVLALVGLHLAAIALTCTYMQRRRVYS